MKFQIFIFLALLAINLNAYGWPDVLWQCHHTQGPASGITYYNHSKFIQPYTSPEQISFDSDAKKTMEEKLERFISKTLKLTGTSYIDKDLGDLPGTWVYLGTASKAITFWKLYLNYKATNISKAQHYLWLADGYIQNALHHMTVHSLDKGVGFLSGNSGIHATAAVIYDTMNRTEESHEQLTKVAEILARDDIKNIDLNCGLAGLIYTTQFLENYFDQGGLFNKTQILKHAHYLFEEGYKNKDQNGALFWPNPAKQMVTSIGMGRGTVGILYVLMRIPEVMANQTIVEHFKKTIDFVLSRQRADGQVVDIQKGMEERIQWCHGAPSGIPFFVLAYQAFGDQKYLDAAYKAADYTFKKGVIVKGFGYCHGISSNILMINFLYRQTKNPKLKYYMTEMHKFAFTIPELTDPDKVVGYDCIGNLCAFHDTPSAIITSYSDFLATIDSDLSNQWMFGFEFVNSPKPIKRVDFSKDNKFLQKTD